MYRVAKPIEQGRGRERRCQRSRIPRFRRREVEFFGQGVDWLDFCCRCCNISRDIRENLEDCDGPEITSPSHLYQRANDIDRGGRRRHDEVTCVSTLSCFGTDQGHDHLEVDDRPFSSFFSTSRIMRPISRQVPQTHDGYLSLCDASSHSAPQCLANT